MPYLVENFPPTEHEQLDYRLENDDKAGDPVDSAIAAKFRNGGKIEENRYLERMPRRIIVTPKSDGSIPDFGQHRWTWIASDRFVDIVEQFEPGLHQFIPFKECLDNEGNFLPRKFYFMNCLTRLQAIDEAKSNIRIESKILDGPIKDGKHHPFPSKHIYWTGHSTDPDYKCFVLNGQEKGYHFFGGGAFTVKHERVDEHRWTFKRSDSQFPDNRYFSDALYEAVQKAGLTPQRYVKSAKTCNKYIP